MGPAVTSPRAARILAARRTVDRAKGNLEAETAELDSAIRDGALPSRHLAKLLGMPHRTARDLIARANQTKDTPTMAQETT